jgi:hypothetical protein
MVDVGSLSSPGSVLGKAADVSVTLSADKQVITARDSLGFKGNQQGERELTFTGDALYVPTTQALMALETAYFMTQFLNFSLLDELGYGYQGQCMISEFRRTENLADAVKCNFSCTSNGTFYRVMAGATTYGA